jgi:hypothetical protein
VAAATTTGTRQQFGREMRLSANLECETAYILPTPFVTGGVPNRDKSPFSPELCYDPETKGPHFVTGCVTTCDKRGFCAGTP